MQNNVHQVDELESDELAPGRTLLYGQYTIERHLIDGGFGMTYLARDSLDRRVVIKECFPCSICRRVDGEVRPRKQAYQEQYQNVIRSFLREALRLAKFEHPNIVKVHQVFQENNTAYIAMDYVDGMDLLSMLDIDPGRLTDAVIETILRETLHALKYVHDMGMLHRDISPDNLLLDAEDNLTLIDFGAAREDATKQSRALSTVMSVKDGYSPHEFYYTDGVQRASSDLYSVGATFYHLISGVAPPDCQKRVAALTSDLPDPFRPLSEGDWSFDKRFLRAIDKALSIPQKDRFASADDWLAYLDAPEDQMPPQAPASQPAEVEEAAATDPDRSPVAELARIITRESEVVSRIRTSRITERELEPALISQISSLVEDTNSKVERGMPGTIREATAPKQEEVREDPATLVDIFGQPIEDVDAWLREQDKQAKRKRAAEKENGADAADQQKDASGKGGGFGLLNVFKKLSKHRSRSVEAAQN